MFPAAHALTASAIFLFRWTLTLTQVLTAAAIFVKLQAQVKILDLTLVSLPNLFSKGLCKGYEIL